MNTLRISKSGASFFFNGHQSANTILPKFLEKFGNIETECSSVDEFIEKELSAYTERWNIEKTERMERNARLAKEYSQKVESDYNALIAAGTIPITAVNLGIVLRYLNEQNWGGWRLPKMSIGYSASQHDCDGRIATTIILDEPIEIDGEKIRRFKIGGGHGYLLKYHRI